MSNASAEDPAIPSWRRGVSTWNGSGYDLPAGLPQQVGAAVADATKNVDSHANQENSIPNSPPYVVPIDPSAPRINPYADLAEEPGHSPLQMTVPYVASNSDSPIAFAPPENSSKPDSKTPVRIATPQLGDSPTSTPLSALIAAPGGATSDDSTAAAAPQSVEELPAPADTPTPIPETQEDDLPAPKVKDSASGTETPDADAEESDSEQSNKADLVDEKLGKASGGAIVPEAVTEQAPLQQEVIRWYQYPRRWMRGWDSHAEFGLDGSDGNANTLAIQTGLELKRKTDLDTLAIDIDYRQASGRNATTEDNGRFNIDYDRLVAETPWSAFGKFGMEWDRFKAFDLRLNVNGGVGYYWVRQDDANLVSRFGAGASREIGAPDDDWVAEAVFGIDADKQLNSRNKLKGKVDYFPAWEDFGNYRLVADVAWEILLDDSDNLSLKLAATDRYDSTPQGAKANDIYYSLLLLYKF